MNLNEPLSKNWVIANLETDTVFLGWTPYLSDNANVLVLDVEVSVEVTDDRQDRIIFAVSNVSQVSGLK